MPYKNLSGQIIHLGQIIARGGEGEIWTVKGQPQLVAKIYDPAKITPTHEAKLKAMLANPPTQPPNHAAIAWPLDILYQQGQFVGFIMPMVDGKPAFNFYLPHLRRQNYPDFNWQYLHRAALNLTRAMQAIHDKGHVVGDVNESNILMQPTALVMLVDSDSFQIQEPQGQIYPCLVGKPEYTPHELQGINFKAIDRRIEHDLFGLSVILFQLLMEGYHPFAAVLPPSSPSVGRVDLHCIKQGIFPYQSHQAAPPPNAPPFTMLYPDLRAMFTRCFVTGHHQPDQRPTAHEWQLVLEAAHAALITCQRNTHHVYSQHISHCPWCELEARAKPNPMPIAAPPPATPATTSVTYPARSARANIRRWAMGGLMGLAILMAMFFILPANRVSRYFFSCNLVSEIPSTECQSLVTFFYAMGGNNYWTNKTGWLASRTPCNWYGITCEKGHVIKIALPRNGLKGELYDMTNLPNLTQLDLSQNRNISSRIPDFSQLPNLTQLNLSWTEIYGVIPNFTHLSKLQFLNVSNCSLSSDIPDFSNIPNLTYLDMSGRSNSMLITGPIPNFTNLPNLTYLNMSEVGFVGSVPEFTHLPHLAHLDLSDNGFGGSTGTITDLPNLPNLTYLDLSGNDIWDDIPNFSHMPNLTYLDLSDNNVYSGRQMPTFDYLPHLQTLILRHDGLAGPLPDFKNWPDLIHLDLSNNELSGLLPDLTHLTHLTYLDLSNNLLSGPLPHFNWHNFEYVALNKNCGFILEDSTQDTILHSKDPHWQQLLMRCP